MRLLTAIVSELKRPGGPELPASWISGFYGSGKSSFAKLLGLALDGMVLPNQQPLAEVLLSRDESPRAEEFRAAWSSLRQQMAQMEPLAVIFDVGTEARDREPIHSVVRCKLQERLGYCPSSSYVAEHELKLELEGQWQSFLAKAQEVLEQPWDVVKGSSMADEDFSLVLHHLRPTLYTDPLSWHDSRAGSGGSRSASVAENTKAISDMLQHRAPGRVVFVVVDEVSQYIYQDNEKMLGLQSLVEDLGQKLKGRVWLLATGQQKLEDNDDSNIGKLKDRFPPRLRVHLAPANIRDVVHKRLLKKSPLQEEPLRQLFQQHRSTLQLYGYDCATLSEMDFLEVYPLLPSYVDLLMSLSTSLRLRSSRARSDDHGIRGLLQLLGELFREQQLGDRPLGSLVTLADVYDVQQSALDNDTQSTMARILRHEQVQGQAVLIQAAKVVALLQIIQEQEPTTASLVSQCLYGRLGCFWARRRTGMTRS